MSEKDNRAEQMRDAAQHIFEACQQVRETSREKLTDPDYRGEGYFTDEDFNRVTADDSDATLRWFLHRRLRSAGPHVVIIGMNPSTAKTFAGKNEGGDPTAGKIIKIFRGDNDHTQAGDPAKGDLRGLAGELTLLNLYPLRSSSPDEVAEYFKRCRTKDLAADAHDKYACTGELLRKILTETAPDSGIVVILAWGAVQGTKKEKGEVRYDKFWMLPGIETVLDVLDETTEEDLDGGGTNDGIPYFAHLNVDSTIRHISPRGGHGWAGSDCYRVMHTREKPEQPRPFVKYVAEDGSEQMLAETLWELAARDDA